MRDDDRDDPFDEFFEEIERMMNEMMGDNAEFHFEHSSNVGGDAGTAGAGGHNVHVDIHETDEEVRVVADVPGVEKESIDLKCDGETLYLQAEGAERDYRESVSLPTRVDEHSADASYNNGILEVTFEPVADDSTDISVN